MEELKTTVLEYVERYATQHGISIEEAKEHAIVKVFEYYKENPHGNFNKEHK